MEITRDALLRIVKATRQGMKSAEIINSLFVDSHGWTIQDEAVGNLKDALFIMIDEPLVPGQQFSDSMTERLLVGDMSDDAVTDFIMMQNRMKSRINAPVDTFDTVEQPKPNIIHPEKAKALARQEGAYVCKDFVSEEH